MTSPYKRQRTLFEYASSSSPTKYHKRTPRLAKKEAAYPVSSGDDRNSDPGNVRFEHPTHCVEKVREENSDLSDPDKKYIHRSSPTHNLQRPPSVIYVRSSVSSSEESELSPRNASSTRSNNRVVVSEESDSQQPRKKRRLVKGLRPGLEDDDDLMEEVDGNMILDSRLRNRSKKSIFAHNLERLQRRRKGQVSDTASADEEDDTTGSESSHSAPSVTSQYFEGAHPMHPSNDSDDQDQNEAEDDFIVEDDDAENIPELPTMFSMGTFQDFSHHFKVICQLFVHLATHDPHRRPSWMKQALGKNYFSVPLAISRRKLSGMRDSLVASSVWKADFKNRLETFPVFHLEQLEFAIPICDACHLGNRVATLRGVLSGCEYDPLTYEPRDKIEEKENEHDAVEFNLGRFCATRVHVFHSFTHWEHILYHSLREEIDRLKEAAICNESRGKARAFIPATNGPPPPDDLEDADGMMDWLDGRGIINAEWIRMKEMMERARKLEARGGEERLNLEG